MNYYDNIKSKLEEEGCTLLTTIDEYNDLYSKIKNKHAIRYKYIAKCGHENDVAYTNFIKRKTGVICKDCVKKNTSHILKTINKTTFHTENNGINIFTKYMSNNYTIKRTNECCIVDLAIKENIKDTDEWIPIQMKTTKKKSDHNMYSFCEIKSHYKDMLLVCICIEEEKIWIIPYNELNVKSRLNISERSKYNKYLIDNNDIEKYIQKYKSSIKRLQLDVCMTPNCELQQRELLYKNKRETCINFLNYTYPIIQQTCVDFIVNGKNVQEKVAGNPKNKSLHITLGCYNERINKKRQYRTYRLGENDFYWFHSSIDDRFWIVPEIELYNNKFISRADDTMKKQNICINYKYTDKTQFLSKYEFNYSNITDDTIMKIKNMFEC
jgi:hypothetical protein